MMQLPEKQKIEKLLMLLENQRLLLKRMELTSAQLEDELRLRLRVDLTVIV